MGATVHTLFVAAAPEVRAPASTVQDALRLALRDGTVEVLDALARQMLDNADDALFRMSEAAISDGERRQYFDTMRVLRLERAAFGDQFLSAIRQTFDPRVDAMAAPAEPTELSIQPTEELEARIAIGNLATRIENQFGAALVELQQRLDAARDRGAAIPPSALTPMSICTAFGTAMAPLRAEFEIKLIICKLFERVLCRDFEQLLQRVGDVLDQHGVDARSGASARRPTVPRRAAVAPSAIGPAAAVAVAATQETAALPDSTRSLVAALLARLAQQPSAATPPAMAELAGMATEFATDRQALARIDALLEAVLARPTPLDHGLPAVIASLREQLRDHRQLLLRQVRGEIARELDLRLAGRTLPAPMLSLLRSGIGPLLAMRLLNGGRDSAAFRDADQLLDRLLDSLDVQRPPSEAAQASRISLLVELRQALISVGMSAARAGLLIDGLIASWAHGDTLPAAGPSTPTPGPAPAPDPTPPPVAEHPLPASSPALLARVLLPDTWFRVFDAARNETRWLKVGSYYAAEDLVRFTGIDDSTQLSLRASRLGRDLIEGRSEPINPSPDSHAALDALRGVPAVEAPRLAERRGDTA